MNINPLRANHEHVGFQKSSEFAKHEHFSIKKITFRNILHLTIVSWHQYSFYTKKKNQDDDNETTKIKKITITKQRK